MAAFVFDFDGVICRCERFTAALEREHGVPGTQWGNFFTGGFRDCLVGAADLKEELAHVVARLGWRESVESLLNYWFETENVVCPRALECVTRLRQSGHRCYLGTNQEAYRSEFMAGPMGMARTFDGIFPSCRIGYTKPSPEFFHRVGDRIGENEIILIDDSLPNVYVAELCGWHAVHYRGPTDLAAVLQYSATPLAAT